MPISKGGSPVAAEPEQPAALKPAELDLDQRLELEPQTKARLQWKGQQRVATAKARLPSFQLDKAGRIQKPAVRDLWVLQRRTRTGTEAYRPSRTKAGVVFTKARPLWSADEPDFCGKGT